MKDAYKSNEQGICPKCQGDNLDYQSAEFVELMAYYRWTCKDCGQEGEEWYNLDFQGHNIYDEEGNIIEL